MEGKEAIKHRRSVSDGQNSCFGKKSLRKRSQSQFIAKCEQWEISMYMVEDRAKKGECIGKNDPETTS